MNHKTIYSNLENDAQDYLSHVILEKCKIHISNYIGLHLQRLRCRLQRALQRVDIFALKSLTALLKYLVVKSSFFYLFGLFMKGPGEGVTNLVSNFGVLPSMFYCSVI